MRIETDRLIIRSPELEDLPSAISIWTDPSVRKYSGGPATEEQVRSGFLKDLKIKDTRYGFRSVLLKETGQHIGDCGLVQKKIESENEIELIYFFNFAYWGKGYATEAALRVRDYAKDNLHLLRIVSLIHPENMASKGVAQKVGMALEKQVTTSSGHLRDLYTMSLKRV